MNRAYLIDSRKHDFNAVITAIDNIDGEYSLTLDHTYFFPSGGGQLADKGTIQGISIVGFHVKNNDIYHHLESPLNLEVGDIVTCEINAQRRLEIMQQHTGQHILSQSIERVLGLKTISFQMKEDTSQLYIPYTDDCVGLYESEVLANSIVQEMIDLEVLNIYPDEGAEYHLRKSPLSKHLDSDGKIRIVKIGEFETIPCGGTHCSNTGQVGLIKIIRMKKQKKKLLLEFVCGGRALSVFDQKINLINKICSLYSVNEDNIEKHFKQKLQNDASLDKKCKELNEKVLKYRANELSLDFSLKNGIKIINAQCIEEMSFDELVAISKLITLNDNYSCMFFCENKFVIAISNNIKANLNAIFKMYAPVFPIKGGGTNKMVQGVISDNTLLKEFLKEFLNQFLSQLN